MTKLLDNKTALVTGGGGGLGVAICQALATDGARIVAVGRDESKIESTVRQVREQGGHAEAISADITDPDAPERLVNETVSHFGGIDILVNCAGVFIWKKFLDQTREDWDTTVATNLSAPFFLTQQVARVMIEQGRGGSILNIVSIHGKMGDGDTVSQCAAKSGLVGLTRATAEALREHDIRVNGLSPGMIAADSGARRGASPREAVTQRDLATLTVFLVSDLARTVTGTVVDAFGGTRSVIKTP